RAQVSHFLEAESIQATKSAGQNSGVRIRGTKIQGSCGGRKIPACGGFTIVDCRKSAHRLIGPSIHRLSTELVLDGPMIRWSDGPILRLSTMYQKKKELAV
ncbi:MAG: hypothetical protein ABSF14_24985, partial [Terriglobia bacterium]